MHNFIDWRLRVGGLVETRLRWTSPLYANWRIGSATGYAQLRPGLVEHRRMDAGFRSLTSQIWYGRSLKRASSAS